MRKLILTFLLLLARNALADRYDAMLLSGDASPSIVGEGYYVGRILITDNRDFTRLQALGRAGHALVRAELSNGVATRTELLRVNPDLSVTPILDEAIPPVGMPQDTLLSMTRPLGVDSVGRVYFEGTLQGSVAGRGYWCASSQNLNLLAREGMSLTNNSTVVDSIFGLPYFALAGSTCQGIINGYVRPAGVFSDYGSFRAVNNLTTSVAIPGSPVPVLSNRIITTGEAVGNDLGDAIVRSGFTSTPSGIQEAEALWVDQNGSYQLIARGGDPAPGLPGYTFYTFAVDGYAPSINSARKVAFAARATTADGFTTKFGIWTNRSGTLQPVFLEGEQAPQAGVGFSIARDYAYGNTSSNPRLVLGDDDSITAVVKLAAADGILPNSIWRVDSVWTDTGSSRIMHVRGCQNLTDTPANEFTPATFPLSGSFKVNHLGKFAWRSSLYADCTAAYTPVRDVLVSNIQGTSRVYIKSGQPVPNRANYEVSLIFAEGSYNQIEINDLNQVLAPVCMRRSGTTTNGGCSYPARIDQNGNFRVMIWDNFPVQTNYGPMSVWASIINYGKALNDRGEVLGAGLQSGGISDHMLYKMTIEPLPMSCLADRNADQLIDLQDTSLFFSQWWNQQADFDGNGTTNSQDLISYLQRWLTGC